MTETHSPVTEKIIPQMSSELEELANGKGHVTHSSSLLRSGSVPSVKHLSTVLNNFALVSKISSSIFLNNIVCTCFLCTTSLLIMCVPAFIINIVQNLGAGKVSVLRSFIRFGCICFALTLVAFEAEPHVAQANLTLPL